MQFKVESRYKSFNFINEDSDNLSERASMYSHEDSDVLEKSIRELKAINNKPLNHKIRIQRHEAASNAHIYNSREDASANFASIVNESSRRKEID